MKGAAKNSQEIYEITPAHKNACTFLYYVIDSNSAEFDGGEENQRYSGGYNEYFSFMPYSALRNMKGARC